MLIIMDNITGCQMLTKEKKLELLSSVARYVLLYMVQMQNICHLNENTVDYICKWTQHLSRMNDTHISNLVYEYTPTRTHVSQPVERLRDP